MGTGARAFYLFSADELLSALDGKVFLVSDGNHSRHNRVRLRHVSGEEQPTRPSRLIRPKGRDGRVGNRRINVTKATVSDIKM